MDGCRQESLEGFEAALIEALQPIRGYALALALSHAFETGVFEALDRSSPTDIGELATRLGLSVERLTGFLLYLQVEDYVRVSGSRVELTEKSQRFRRFRPWYEMLIGGYGATFAKVKEGLSAGGPPLPRCLEKVGSGSCGISHYDAIPLTARLLGRLPRPPRMLVDLGCGNALYLAELCESFPGLRAVGIEPSRGYERAQRLIEARGLSDRVSLFNGTAQEFLEASPPGNVDAIVLGFVLHEILGQESEAGTVAFLRAMAQRFPSARFVVIEVENWIADLARMRHGLAQAYYNPYFLLHYFTNQRLERHELWSQLFEDAELRVLHVETTDPRVDSTGFELGFLLEAR